MSDKTGLTVQRVEILRDRRVKVTFDSEKGGSEAFATADFGVGRRGAKCAALARFLSKSLGVEAEHAYRFLRCLPINYVGLIDIPPVFTPPVLSLVG